MVKHRLPSLGLLVISAHCTSSYVVCNVSVYTWLEDCCMGEELHFLGALVDFV